MQATSQTKVLTPVKSRVVNSVSASGIAQMWTRLAASLDSTRPFNASSMASRGGFALHRQRVQQWWENIVLLELFHRAEDFLSMRGVA